MAFIRKILKKILTRPTRWMADRFSSSPHKKDVFSSLSDLLKRIEAGKEGGESVAADINSARYIIFSDQHKGAGDMADDFRLSKRNYSAALDHYLKQQFTFV